MLSANSLALRCHDDVTVRAAAGAVGSRLEVTLTRVNALKKEKKLI